MRMKIFCGLLLAFLTICISETSAQAYDEGGNYSNNVRKNRLKLDKDRTYIGGGFGASFGNITLVEIAPSFAYLFTDNLLAGISTRYIYYQEKIRFNTQTVTFKTNIYGGGPFVQYFFTEEFLGHAEIEILNLEDFRRPNKRINITSIFLGGGYRSYISDNAFASILLLYNINDDINSPYSNPVLRVGFNIGL